MFTENTRSIITKTDSYKLSHHLQYPEGTEKIFSYIEARGGMYSHTLVFGLQAYIKKYLMKPITANDIDIAEEFVNAHVPGSIFNRKGWEYILTKHNGFLPIKIKAVKEGSLVTVRNALVTIENTDLKSAWLVGHLETSLLRGLWAPTTCATRSYEIKKICKNFLTLTSDITNNDVKLDWMLHDFGMRGTKSGESAAITGAAHLINFNGTDTIDSIYWANEYYASGITGFSIPASEHSVATLYGRDNEVGYMQMMINKFARQGSIFACVCDSYDVFNFISTVLPQVKQSLIDSGSNIVIRPDSGDPIETPIKVIQLLADVFDYTVNSKGYKILNTVKVIQGDGINEESIRLILEGLRARGFSAENISFGCGGYLLDSFNRDTQKWAMKCSAAIVNGQYRDVYKEPITDPGKTSKRGILELVSKDNVYKTIREVELLSHIEHGWTPELDVVFENGKLIRTQSFADIRELSNTNKGI